MLFEMMKAKVASHLKAGFEVLVVGDVNSYIGLSAEQSPNMNCSSLLDLFGVICVL